jgi:hypothetical protein
MLNNRGNLWITAVKFCLQTSCRVANTSVKNPAIVATVHLAGELVLRNYAAIVAQRLCIHQFRVVLLHRRAIDHVFVRCHVDMR